MPPSSGRTVRLVMMSVLGSLAGKLENTQGPAFLFQVFMHRQPVIAAIPVPAWDALEA